MKPINIPINTPKDKQVILAIIKAALKDVELADWIKQEAHELYESVKKL